MDAGIPLVGQSNKFQVQEDSLAQVDLSLSAGQQYTPSPVTYCGTIVDHATGQAVPDAMVILRNGPYTYNCRTSRAGRFEIILPAHWSVASVQISKRGYSTRYIGTRFLDHSNETFYVY